MAKQTYENYHKEYYKKNRARIQARTKAYRKMAQHRYYLENRERILAERKEKRRLARIQRESSLEVSIAAKS